MFKAVLAKAKTLINFDETEPSMSTFQQTAVSQLGESNTSSSVQVSSSSQPNLQQIQQSQQSSSLTSTVSYQFMKQYYNSDQQKGLWNDHTVEFKKFRDNSIGRYVVQTNKLLITLDKLITIDEDMFTDDAKREGISELFSFFYSKNWVSFICDF